MDFGGGRTFCFLRFYLYSLFKTTSGGSIFLLVKKDRGERHAKGLQSRPLESGFYTGVRRGDVLASYEFARVQFTRFRPARRRAGGVRFTRLRRKAKHHLFSAISLPKALLPPDSVVLRQLPRKHVGTSVIWAMQHAERMEAVRSHAMRDLIASNAPLRKRRHKVRPASSKTLPRGSNGGRSPLGLSFSPICLQTKKDGVPEGRRNSREAGKNAGSRVYFSSGSTTPFFSKAFIRSIQVPHFPQGFSPPS